HKAYLADRGRRTIAFIISEPRNGHRLGDIPVDRDQLSAEAITARGAVEPACIGTKVLVSATAPTLLTATSGAVS
ncbi:MAG: hypothetical protein ACLP22_02420, partial [Solirubrobacteraceae bacterium]